MASPELFVMTELEEVTIDDGRLEELGYGANRKKIERFKNL
jgi:hypothetical protein